MASKKRKVLTLDERVKAIKLVESGKSSRKVAEDFGVGRTQIQETLKRKREIMEDYENNLNPTSKRPKRESNFEQVNELILKWIKDANSRRISVSGPLVQQRALKFAEELGLNDFKASSGWLEKLLKRNNIIFKTMSGERGDVNVDVVNDWISKISSLCEGYTPSDIFNMDETGIFYKSGKKTTLHASGSDCAGGKHAKDRITVALCASMAGEKLKPLVIGKFENPRCFSKIDKRHLPVTYKFNKKSWMNSKIFEDWLKSVDSQMRRQGRKILLFVDNAPSHPHIDVKNVKLRFLPPNTTALIQPMDQGIIQTVKLKYYRYQNEHILVQMEKFPSKCGSDLLKGVNVLDAIYWLNRAWNAVESSTVVKCFNKCVFDTLKTGSDSVEVEEEDAEDNVPLSVLKLSKELFGCEFSELAELEKNIPTCDTNQINWDLPATELLNEREDCDSDDNDGDSQNDSETEKVYSVSEAFCYIDSLKAFACSSGNSKMLDCVMELSALATEMRVECSSRQTKISDFFRK